MKGGARPGAGRKPGSVNKMTLKAREEAAKSGQLPHEFVLAVARGEEIDGYRPTFAERVDAAKVAAPYFAPRLGTLQVATDEVNPDPFVAHGDPRTMPKPDLFRAIIGRLARNPGAWSKFIADEGVKRAIATVAGQPAKDE